MYNMKKLLFLLCFAVIIFALQTYAVEFVPFIDGATPESGIMLNYNEHLSGIQIQLEVPGISRQSITHDGTPYTKLSINGAGIKGIEGEPGLPFRGFYLEVPPGVTLSIDNVVTEHLYLSQSNLIYPNQNPVPGSAPSFHINNNAYQINDFQPGELVQITEDGVMRGRRVVFVEVNTIQYNPVSNTLKNHYLIDFDITYIGEPDSAALLERQRLASPFLDSLYSGIIMNYEILDPVPQSSYDGGCDYLIVTHENFVNDIAPLADWKQQKGFLTKTITVTAQHSAEDVKNIIEMEYEKTPAPSFVLLVGKHGYVRSFYFGRDETPSVHMHFYSDYPYSLMDGPYDKFPDFNLGRISVNDSSKCQAAVGKILRYDQNPDIDNYYSRFVTSGPFLNLHQTEDCQEDYYSLETLLDIQEYLDNAQNMHPVPLYFYEDFQTCSSIYNNPVPHPAHPITNPPQLNDYKHLIGTAISRSSLLKSELNDGLGLLVFIGHGDELVWHGDFHQVPCDSIQNPKGIGEIPSIDYRAPPTAPHMCWDVRDFLLTDDDVDALIGSQKTPVVLSFACFTGTFSEANTESLVERMLSKEDAGAVGVVAASTITFVHYTELFSRGVMSGFFHNYDPSYNESSLERSFRVSDAMTHGKLYVRYFYGEDFDNYLTFLDRIFHYFGDPELQLRTKAPVYPDITVPSYIAPGTEILTFHSSNNGALIGVSQSDNLIGRGIVDDGVAVIELWEPVTDASDVLVVVTGKNLKPVEYTVLTTQPPPPQEPPKVLFGGYLDTALVNYPDSSCGRINALMYVENPEAPISNAGLTNLPNDPWQEPVIIQTFDPVQGSSGFYSWYHQYDSGDPITGPLIYGMAATDTDGLHSHHWPFVPVRSVGVPNPPAGGINWDQLLTAVPGAELIGNSLVAVQNAIQELNALNPGPSAQPIIWQAGYLNTDLTVGETNATVKIAAVVSKDQNGIEIDRIDLLNRHGHPLHYIPGPGVEHEGFYYFYGEYIMDEVYPPEDNLTYLWMMQAVDVNDNWSQLWPEVPVLTPHESAPEITSANFGDTQCHVRWFQDNRIEINSFVVSWLNQNTYAMGNSGHLNYTQTFHTISGLTNCDLHTIWVKAYDLCGNELVSESVTGKPSLLPIPQDIRIEGNANSPSGFNINWDSTDGPYYALYWGYAPDPDQMSFVAVYPSPPIPQPVVSGDFTQYFAVRSVFHPNQPDPDDDVGCFSDVVRGQKLPSGIPGVIRKVMLTDLLNNGMDDLVVLTDCGLIQVYFGEIDGTWTLSDQTWPSLIRDFTLFDFNRDGYMDLSLAGTGEVYTYFNNGDGVMSLTDVVFPPGQNHVIESDRMDAGNTSDILVGNTDGTFIKVNDETGQTVEYQYLNSGDTRILLTADVTGDGQNELITATETGETILWTKDETGLYGTLQTLLTWGATSVRTVDVTKNGCPDLIVVDDYDQSVVFINDCNGFFTLQP